MALLIAYQGVFIFKSRYVVFGTSRDVQIGLEPCRGTQGHTLLGHSYLMPVQWYEDLIILYPTPYLLERDYNPEP